MLAPNHSFMKMG